jgi:uncharacterized protein YaaQ
MAKIAVNRSKQKVEVLGTVTEALPGTKFRVETDRCRVTVVSTTGGFLRQGNATLLIDVLEQDVAGALAIIQANCRTRLAHANPLPPTAEPLAPYASAPIEVRSAGRGSLSWTSSGLSDTDRLV